MEKQEKNKNMTQEEKAKAYDEAVKRAKAAIDVAADKDLVGGVVKTILPELRESESEDERIIKLIRSLLENVRNVQSNTSLYKQYDDALAWLEKQKETENVSASTMIPSCWAEEPSLQNEQKPVEPSDDELQRYQDELYDFKVFATKQAKEHHISFVHDFEWNNFCAGLLSYFNEQKPAECIEDSVKFEEGFKAGRESGLRDGQKYVLNNLDSYGLCKPAEWSEEDEEKIVTISEIIEHCTTIPYSGGTLTLNKEYKKELLCFIKSLRPQYHGDVTMTEAYKMGLEAGKASSWKPSEHQMTILKAVKDYVGKGSGYWGEALSSLIEDLKKL